jgi:hypothetical protein
VQLEVPLRAEDLLAEVAGGARFLERFLEALVDLEDLAVDVVVGDVDAHRVRRDRHPFDDDVRVEHQQVAVLAGAGLAFVGIADEVLGARELARHEAPLEAGRKACAAAAAQARRLDLGDHLLGRHALALALLEESSSRPW